MDNLTQMLQAQRDLQINSFGKDPCELKDEELIEFLRWNAFALEDELHEAFGEVGWKPWAISRHVHVDPFRKELIDAWHFFMNLLLASHGPMVLQYGTDWLSDLFTLGYFDKRDVNAKRQEDGYDGVSGKCPGCKRDRAETELADFSNGYRTIYCPCGHIYENTLL